MADLRAPPSAWDTSASRTAHACMNSSRRCISAPSPITPARSRSARPPMPPPNPRSCSARPSVANSTCSFSSSTSTSGRRTASSHLAPWQTASSPRSSRAGRRPSAIGGGTLSTWRIMISPARWRALVSPPPPGSSRRLPLRPRISSSAAHLSSTRARKSGCSAAISPMSPISATSNPSTTCARTLAKACPRAWRQSPEITDAPPCSGMAPPPPALRRDAPGSTCPPRPRPLTSRPSVRIPAPCTRTTARSLRRATASPR